MLEPSQLALTGHPAQGRHYFRLRFARLFFKHPWRPVFFRPYLHFFFRAIHFSFVELNFDFDYRFDFNARRMQTRYDPLREFLVCRLHFFAAFVNRDWTRFIAGVSFIRLTL